MKKTMRVLAAMLFIGLSANTACAGSMQLTLANDSPDVLLVTYWIGGTVSPTLTLASGGGAKRRIDNPTAAARVCWGTTPAELSANWFGRDVPLWQNGKPTDNTCHYKKCTADCYGKTYRWHCDYEK
jgi:hypothetical protein